MNEECLIYNLCSMPAVTDGEYLYIKEAGELVPVGESGDSYLLRSEASDGKLIFSVDGKFGFADIKTSRITVPPVWDYVSEYAYGLAWVYRTDEDKSGLNPLFSTASRGSKAHIDMSGTLLSELVPFDNAKHRTPAEAYRLAKHLLDCGDYYFADELLREAGSFDDAENLRIAIQWKCCERGKKVRFGSYLQRRKTHAEAERIMWTILAIESGKALLTSDKSLDALPYHSGQASVTWENSTLREWLNNYFLHTAFSESEQDCILPMKLENSIALQQWKLSGGADTVDCVFIPGLGEESLAEATEYARKKLGLPPQTKKTDIVPHLLRWPVLEGRYSACTIPEHNQMLHAKPLFGVNTAETIGAIRPMLWVDLDALRRI